MSKVRNKKTGVVKEPRTEIEVSMYLATNQWELVKDEKKDSKVLSTPKEEDKK